MKRSLKFFYLLWSVVLLGFAGLSCEMDKVNLKVKLPSLALQDGDQSKSNNNSPTTTTVPNSSSQSGGQSKPNNGSTTTPPNSSSQNGGQNKPNTNNNSSTTTPPNSSSQNGGQRGPDIARLFVSLLPPIKGPDFARVTASPKVPVSSSAPNAIVTNSYGITYTNSPYLSANNPMLYPYDLVLHVPKDKIGMAMNHNLIPTTPGDPNDPYVKLSGYWMVINISDTCYSYHFYQDGSFEQYASSTTSHGIDGTKSTYWYIINGNKIHGMGDEYLDLSWDGGNVLKQINGPFSLHRITESDYNDPEHSCHR